MLILTRKVGESIRIGDDVEILVADANGMAVKLGIEAPKDIQVHRKEVYERIATPSSLNVKDVSQSRLMSINIRHETPIPVFERGCHVN